MRAHTLFRTTLKQASIVLLGLTLAACGSSSNNSRLNPGDGGNGGGNGGGGGGGGGTSEVSQIGRGIGADFVAGEIAVGIDGTLSPGGTTTLSVNLVNANGNLVTETVSVTFNSLCIAAGESSLGGDATITTTTGQASVSYTSGTCVGEDRITATAQSSTSTLSAEVSLNIASADANNILWMETSAPRISLKGVGGNEVSRVTLKVASASGAPIKGVEVEFKLSTRAGGASLINESATSDSSGFVVAEIQAGVVASSVSLSARVPATNISSEFPAVVVVSSGTPEQKSFTLSPSVFNPPAWDYNGVPVDFSVFLLDAFNNPIPDGTEVYLTTNGGGITSSCTTVNGICDAEWRSQGVRPASGRVRVLAMTIGNESFIDTTGDGWFTPGEDIFVTSLTTTDIAECQKNAPRASAVRPTDPNHAVCDDLGDPYLDANFNGMRDSDEEFFSLNANPSGYQDGNGLYNGTLCREADEELGLCSREMVYIRSQAEIVMSCDSPLLIGGMLPGQPAGPITLPETVEVVLADCNGNALPVGTIVSINIADTENVKVNRTSVEIPSTLRAQTASFILSPNNGVPSGSFYFTIDAAVPGGTLTTETASTVVQ